MTITTPLPVSDYAPQRDPLRLAGVTLKAVDEIGDRAAAEISEAAKTLRTGADMVASNLEQLADAILAHTKEAGSHVQEFLDHAEQVLTTVRALQARPANGAPPSDGNNQA